MTTTKLSSCSSRSTICFHGSASLIGKPTARTLLPNESTIHTDSTNPRTEHLNANRMLRARKMATYVAEKLEPPDPNVEPDPDAMRADAYIDLLCNNQLLAPKTTLAWMKSHIWRGGGEMVIQYKANGQKRIVPTANDLIYVGQAAEEQKQNIGTAI